MMAVGDKKTCLELLISNQLLTLEMLRDKNKVKCVRPTLTEIVSVKSVSAKLHAFAFLQFEKYFVHNLAQITHKAWIWHKQFFKKMHALQYKPPNKCISLNIV